MRTSRAGENSQDDVTVVDPGNRLGSFRGHDLRAEQTGHYATAMAAEAPKVLADIEAVTAAHKTIATSSVPRNLTNHTSGVATAAQPPKPPTVPPGKIDWTKNFPKAEPLKSEGSGQQGPKQIEKEDSELCGIKRVKKKDFEQRRFKAVKEDMSDDKGPMCYDA